MSPELTRDGVVGDGRVVDAELDTGIGAVVRTREADRCGGLGSRTASDGDLRTLHVELGAGVAARSMQSWEKQEHGQRSLARRGYERRRTDNLVSEEVLAGGDAAGDGERDLALVGNQGVDGPGLGCGVVAVLVDLEPLQASHRRLSGARDLCTRNDTI